VLRLVIGEEVLQVGRHMRLQQSDVIYSRCADDELLRLWNQGVGVGGRRREREK
jgi:hypothetical protein